MDKAAFMNQVLEALVDSIDVPPSHYKLAIERYESLGRWFHRDGSPVAELEPDVLPQGSFRLGTPTRPVFEHHDYDLDLVCHVLMTKGDTTQERLKRLIGDDVKAYAQANNLKADVEERKRCWRLPYADKVSFHLDVLPAIPNDEFVKQALLKAGVADDEAVSAIAITDKDHPNYTVQSTDWPQSNPEGFAQWFEKRMRLGKMRHADFLVKQGHYASIQDVPMHECKTILQRVIQLLKRHRDVMFKDNCDLRPISIIITTLAARAYRGQTDLYQALVDIVNAMPSLVRAQEPRIPNPVNPHEDFTDKWKNDPRLERNFWTWHKRVAQDIERLADPEGPGEHSKFIKRAFDVSIDEDSLICFGVVPAAVIAAAPRIHISSGPQPWSDRA
ncbi:MAG TPA: nucleotidyltransferase [Phycisphaerae bacterium]|nr:nucleotidyltransferase [Phycisphaerae bacterium]